MRFGLVGTGHWARVTHGAALAQEPGVEFVAVWGRDPEKVSSVSKEFDVEGWSDFDGFLDRVEAVAFAVPPQVQAKLASRAADAGKHLLLEKPVTTSVSDAEQLVAAVDRAGVSSVVFFTQRFSATIRDWLAAVEDREWGGGWARWFCSVLAPGNPYGSSAWRQEKGALWDVGPHVLAVLMAALGPVESVVADRGRGDLVHLIFQHELGATSTASLTLAAPTRAANEELSLWGPGGLSTMPISGSTAEEALGVAVRELMANVAIRQVSHRCDVRFGAAIVTALSYADQQVSSNGRHL